MGWSSLPVSSRRASTSSSAGAKTKSAAKPESVAKRSTDKLSLGGNLSPGKKDGRKPKIAIGETWKTRSDFTFKIIRQAPNGDFVGDPGKLNFWTFDSQGRPVGSTDGKHDLITKL